MIDLPREWAGKGYALRPARARDRAFQCSLFGLCRPDAQLIAQWPPAQRDAFLASQFALQDIHYRRFYEGADYFILTRGSARIGRLILHRSAREWRVVDIGLMPEERGRGLGAALLRALQASCAAAGVATLALQVEFGNRARRLYARLGFVETENTDVHIAMQWKAAGQLKTAS